MTARMNALERAFAEELELAKTAALHKTAADQIDEILVKMSSQTKCSCGAPMMKVGEITKCSKCGSIHKKAAALDGSDLMNKLNPVGRTQSGVDARSVDSGLQQLVQDKHGRGVAERTARDRVMRAMKLEQDVHDVPIFSPEEGTYPLRRSIGVPKVGYDMLQAAAALEQRRRGLPKVGKAAGQEQYEQLTPGQKAGLIGGGLGLGAVGTGVGLYGAHKAVQAGRQAQESGEKAIAHISEAGKDVAEQARVVGDKVSRASDALTEASRRVSAAVEPAARVAEKGGEAKARVQKKVEDVVERGRGAKKKVVDIGKGARDVIVDAVSKAVQKPKQVSNLVGLLRNIPKVGEDRSFQATIMKLAAEGQLRTFEGWR